jgi:hypothetical protein
VEVIKLKDLVYMAVSVKGLHRRMNSKFVPDYPGDGLDDESMVKLIVWCVQAFKKEYPLLFDREYSARGPKVKYEWDELLAFDYYCIYQNKRSCRAKTNWKDNDDEYFRYVLNYKQPGKTTVSDFKLKNPLLFLEFFQFTVDLGVKFNLIGGDVVVLDSTNIKAYANKFRTLSIVQLEYLLDLIHDLSFNTSKNSEWNMLKKYFFKDKLPEDLVYLVDEINDNLNRHGINLLKTALQSREKRDWVVDFLDELVNNFDGVSRVNLTDMESRRLLMKDGRSRYAYTVQTVRDIKNGFIVSQEVTQEKNDRNAMESAIDNTISALGKSPRFLAADNGYFTIKSLEYCFANNIVPLIPNNNDSIKRNGSKKDKMFDPSNMRFDCINEFFWCPYGQKLKKRSRRRVNGTLKFVFKTYNCPDCPYHEECTSKKYKEVLVQANPLFLESKKNFLSDVGQYFYTFRGIYSEGGFGTMKNGRGDNSLHRTGKQKADIDLKIEATLDNLIKIRDHLNATLITL